MPSPAHGRQGKGCWSASTRSRAVRVSCAIARRQADRLRAPWTALTSKPRARPPCRKRTRTGSRHICAWRSSSAAKRQRSQARMWRRISFATRRRTTLPTSSSASRPGRDGANFSKGRLPTSSSATAGNISIHVTSGTELDAGTVPKGVRTAARAEAAPTLTLPAVDGLRRRRAGVERTSRPVPRCPQPRAGLPDGRADLGGDRWALAGALRKHPQRAGLQFLFPRASLYADDQRPRERGRVLLFPRRRRHRQQSHGTRPAPGGSGAATGADHRRPLSLQPQAGRHRNARRRALGDRVPDRVDVEAARRPASARGQLDCREGGLSARRYAGRCRHRGGALGMGAQSRRRSRRRHACRAPRGFTSRFAPGARRSA